MTFDFSQPHKLIDGIPVILISDEISALNEINNKWQQLQIKRDVLLKIRNLEDSVTPRRIREACLTDDAKQWLSNVNNQIITLRGQLL